MINQFDQQAGTVRFMLLAVFLPILAGCMNIHKAANRGDLDGMRHCLQRGVGVDVRDRYGRTPLMYVLSDLDKVRYLVGEGADVNARDNRGETPLMKAAFLGQVDVARYLVGQGAEVNAQDERGVTPLMQAVRHLDMIEFLVGAGADLNAVDRTGESLLLKAAVSGRLSTVQYLLQSGAAVESAADGAGTP
jgi:ankyrin repeat protein